MCGEEREREEDAGEDAEAQIAELLSCLRVCLSVHCRTDYRRRRRLLLLLSLRCCSLRMLRERERERAMEDEGRVEMNSSSEGCLCRQTLVSMLAIDWNLRLGELQTTTIPDRDLNGEERNEKGARRPLSPLSIPRLSNGYETWLHSQSERERK